MRRLRLYASITGHTLVWGAVKMTNSARLLMQNFNAKLGPSTRCAGGNGRTLRLVLSVEGDDAADGFADAVDNLSSVSFMKHGCSAVICL
jgi:hypothetical protein